MSRRDDATGRDVLLKDTTDHPYDEVMADPRFLAAARHAFLIRRPEEIAASYYSLFPPMTINAIGMERLCVLQAAISEAGGNPPVIIDSDDPCTPGRSTGSGASTPPGDVPPAGTRMPATAPASPGANASTRIPSRTAPSWPGTPLTTGPSTSNSMSDGWMSLRGSDGQVVVFVQRQCSTGRVSAHEPAVGTRCVREPRIECGQGRAESFRHCHVPGVVAGDIVA